MNIDINNIDSKLLEEDDRIVAFLKGQMSAEEEKKFLKELEYNQELKEKAIITARLVKGMKDVGTEQDSDIQRAILASSRQDLESVTKKAVQKKARVLSFSKTAKWLSIAASVICIVWFGFTYNSYRTTTALGNEYDDVFTSSMIVRGQESQTEAEKKLLELFSNVKENENIDKSIQELSLYWELSSMETYNDYTDYASEIGWNLAIAYLKNNDRKGAKIILGELMSTLDDESAIGMKAKELFSKIN